MAAGGVDGLDLEGVHADVSVFAPGGPPREDEAGQGAPAPTSDAATFDSIELGPWLELPITLSLAYPETHGIAQLLQAELEKLGVKASIDKLEAAQYSAKLSGAKFNGIWMGIFAWMNKTPSTLFVQSFAYRVPNAQNFDTADYRQVLDATLRTTDATELAKVYRRLDEILLDESFVIPIASANRPFGATAAVKGVTLTRDSVPVVGEFWKNA